MLLKAGLALLMMSSCAVNAHAITPSGGWKLQNETPHSKDYSLRIDVDPGEKYDIPGLAPSSVYWAQYVASNATSGGYLGLQRVDGQKRALVSIWGGLDAKGSTLPALHCYEFGPCVSIKGYYG